MNDPIAQAQAFLAELEESAKQPRREHEHWLLGHENVLRQRVSNLLQWAEAYGESSQTVTLLALKLLDAIKPLLSARGIFRDHINGTAPRLRERYEALREKLDQLEM